MGQKLHTSIHGGGGGGGGGGKWLNNSHCVFVWQDKEDKERPPIPS